MYWSLDNWANDAEHIDSEKTVCTVSALAIDKTNDSDTQPALIQLSPVRCNMHTHCHSNRSTYSRIYDVEDDSDANDPDVIPDDNQNVLPTKLRLDDNHIESSMTFRQKRYI